MTITEYAAMALTHAMGDEWRTMSLMRDLAESVDHVDPNQEPLPERPRWPQDG